MSLNKNLIRAIILGNNVAIQKSISPFLCSLISMWVHTPLPPHTNLHVFLDSSNSLFPFIYMYGWIHNSLIWPLCKVL